MGGTLALYASRGVAVHLVCATRGEVGIVHQDCLKNHQTIAELRISELNCASKVLGLSSVHLLDYRDSGMPNTRDNNHPQALAAQPIEMVADEIIDWIRRLKPQVVVTFDPIGGYHHPDHIAIHRATTAAFHAAGDASRGRLPVWHPSKLYFHTMPHDFLRFAVKILPLFGQDPRRFGANGDIDLTVIAANRFPTHAIINTRRFLRIQEEASACHASQGGQEMNRGLRAWFSRLFSGRDTFMRDHPRPVDGEPIEDDLFTGISVK
ncbi:MAG: PIG-L family deacetylase [Anaerolineaceae bacterium]|nr:PIG-L family deacetylase [Anaerolineaceae bacterium]MBN2676625.1 PIG-L family deacetylase [Anaerolineaceae bacterium]